MNDLKKHICWNITTRCNAECSFCHRIKDYSDLSLNSNSRILDNLIKCGVRKITWTGGEALLYEGIESLLKKSKSHGITNQLITNGILLTKERIDIVLPFLDSITLSLDSCDNNTNQLMGRGYNQYKNISEIVSYIKEKYSSVNIKINTVACKYNINNIIEISDFILENRIFRWKIFRFMDLRGDSIVNKDNFWISSKDFNDVKRKITQKLNFNNYHNLFFIDIDSFEKYYILIRADGAVIITQNKKDYVLGNLMSDDYSFFKSII